MTDRVLVRPIDRTIPTSCTVLLLLFMFMGSVQPAVSAGATAVDKLVDLTGQTSVVVTLTGRDNFANEFRYDVRVKNQSTSPFEADSLVLVLDQIIDLAGKGAFDRVEVVGQDGETADRKPYFRVPIDGSELIPYHESGPATVILKNTAYTIVFTPSFRVLGQPKLPPQDSLQSLVDLLIKRGLLTEEEGATINRRLSAPTTPP